MTNGGNPEPAGTPTSLPDVVSIRGPAGSKVDWQVHEAMMLVAPVSVVLIVFLTVGGPGHDTAIKLGLAVGAIVSSDLALLEIVSYPRRLTIDRAGVVLRFRLHRTTKTWSELAPDIRRARGYYSDQGWFLFFQPGPAPSGKSRRRGCLLSDAQARAILLYPSGKEWQSSGEIKEFLGLSQPSSS